MEAVVLDAGVGVGLLYSMPYSPACQSRMESWVSAGVKILVPGLWDYEVVSALRKLRSAGMLSKEDAEAGLGQLYRLPVKRMPVNQDLAVKALLWADRLEQFVAYDAQYLAVAELNGADLWTADRKLHKRCTEKGVGFVNLIG